MIVAILIAAGSRAGPVPAFDAELELERAIHREIVLGDPLGAIEEYRGILARRDAPYEVVARALLRLGRCQEVLGRRSEARDSYSRLIRDYGDQTPIVSQARAQLAGWEDLQPGPVDAQDRAQMFLSVDRTNRQTGFFDNMNDRPIRSLEWTKYEIVGPVDRDATFINFGFMSIGKGPVWVDAVSFEVVR
jgi:hypothetical protein